MSMEEISPRACRMWHMHERLGEYIDGRTCASLVESMQKHGQKQPVLGRRVTRVDGIDIELIYGARRLFAAQHLRRKLLVDVRDLDDRTALIEMDIENRVRADISPYERGLSYRRWLNAGHFKSQVEVAKALGVSEPQISRLLKYAAIPAAVVEAFESPGDIREEWAVVLANKCQDPECRISVIERARGAARSGQVRTPQVIYSALVQEGKEAVKGIRVHDEVVTDSTGRPVLRIGFRAKTVHLILPRESVTSDMLAQISEQLKNVLVSNKSRRLYTQRPLAIDQKGSTQVVGEQCRV